MAKYVFIYTGTGEMPQGEQEMAEVMAAWEGWFATIGADLVDGGNPFADRKVVTPDGSVADGPVDIPLSGYSIVQAADLDAATAVAKGCPVLGAGGSVHVAETIDM